MTNQTTQPPQWGQTSPPPPKVVPKKKRHPILWTLVVFAVLLFVLPAVFSGNDTSTTGTGERPAAPTEANKAKAEDTTVLQAGSDEVGITHDIWGSETAAIMVSKPEWNDDQSEYGIPAALVFTVAVAALKDNISSPEFYLLTRDGQKIDETYFYAGNERHLDLTTLQKGEKQAGTIAFESPGKHGKLIVPGGDGKPQVTWTF